MTFTVWQDPQQDRRPNMGVRGLVTNDDTGDQLKYRFYRQVAQALGAVIISTFDGAYTKFITPPPVYVQGGDADPDIVAFRQPFAEAVWTFYEPPPPPPDPASEEAVQQDGETA